MPRISLYSPSIASAVLPQGYVPRDTSLFGEGRGLPSGGASTSTMAGGQKGVFGSDGGGAMGTIAGMLGGPGLRSVFFGAPEDPRAAQARAAAENYAAEAAAKRAEAERAAAGAAATSKLGAAFGDIRTRQQPTAAPSPAMARIIEEEPYSPDAAARPAGSEAARMRAAAAAALQEALAGGADEKQARALMSAFALGLGDDNEIVRVNAALDDKYLGDNESPSLTAQIEKREDEQRQEIEKQDMIEKTRRYGFDKESADRRYNTDVDAATSRANNASTNATSARNNDRDNARALEEQRRQMRFQEILGSTSPTVSEVRKTDADGKTTTETTTTRRTPARRPAATPARGAAQAPKKTGDPLVDKYL